MKKIFYMLVGAGLISSGCLKDKADDEAIVQPQGKFAGQFVRTLLNKTTKEVTTTKYDVQIELVNNTYKFTGDTSKHAGSNGQFTYNQSYITWIDNTVPAGVNSVNLPKPHLNGKYVYQYNGNLFQFEASNDTLSYFYDLKKQP